MRGGFAKSAAFFFLKCINHTRCSYFEVHVKAYSFVFVRVLQCSPFLFDFFFLATFFDVFRVVFFPLILSHTYTHLLPVFASSLSCTCCPFAFSFCQGTKQTRRPHTYTHVGARVFCHTRRPLISLFFCFVSRLLFYLYLLSYPPFFCYLPSCLCSF